MTNQQEPQRAWQAYQQAVNAVYKASTPVAAADRGLGPLRQGQIEARGDTVLARSAELRHAFAAGLQTRDPGQRELAALKLVAAAAYDLSVANDLLEREALGLEAEPQRSARGALLASEELRSVLDAPLEEGMRGLLEVERAILPNDPAGARAELERCIATFVYGVPQQAADLSQMALGGAVNLGMGPAQAAASVATQEILARLPAGISPILQRVARLVVEAIEKLRASFGVEQEEAAREQIAGWLEDLQKNRDTVTGLLDRLYETPRIATEVSELVSGAPDGTEAARYNQATRTLEEMLARYGKTKGVAEQAMRILAVAKAPLLAAQPWGTLAVYGAYLGLLGYAIYSGGDYMDWYRAGDTDWLDRVQGLRTTVRRSLG